MGEASMSEARPRSMKLGLSNEFMDSTLSQLSPYYAGTFACDQLYSYLPPCLTNRSLKTSMVVNTGLSSHPDGHFIALCFRQNLNRQPPGYIYFYDPLGLNFDLDGNINAYLVKLVKESGWSLIYNPQATQDILSISCSLFVLAFILHHDSNDIFKAQSFYSKFNFPPNLKNDEIAQNLILKYISTIS